MKRFLALVLVVIFALSLVACGDSSSKKSSKKSSGGSSAVVTTAPQAKTEKEEAEEILVGSWYGVGFLSGEDFYGEDEIKGDFYADFNANGTGSVTIGEEDFDIEWEFYEVDEEIYYTLEIDGDSTVMLYDKTDKNLGILFTEDYFVSYEKY